MTAYIKMIDVWMIFAMIYPFCVVTLYSALEFLKAHYQDIPVALKIEKTEWKIKKAEGIVNQILDLGLSIIVIIFITVFFILGIINSTSAEISKIC